MMSSRSPGRAGAMPNPQLPCTTVVTPCHDDGVRSGSQNTCASKWVWMSTKPGDKHQAGQVDLAGAGRVGDLTDGGDAPVDHFDVGPAARATRAVDHCRPPSAPGA